MIAAILCMALTLGACSNGEDGTDGLSGKNGDQGAAGVNGVSCWDLNGNGIGDSIEDANQDGNFDALDCQGEQGEQGNQGGQGATGNANDEEHADNHDDLSDYTFHTLDLNDIVDEPANYAYLFYLVYVIDPDVYRIPIPGNLSHIPAEAGVIINWDTGEFLVQFRNVDNGQQFTIPGSPFPELIVVAIEHNNTSKNSENVMAELKAAGVDTNDYNAVAAYFGL